MNNLTKLAPYKPVLIGTLVSIISACGSSDSSSLTSGRGGTANSMFSLNITDAAVDDADEVWVQFSGVTLQPSSDDEASTRLEFTFDPPKSINLLDLQGTNVQSLLENEVVPAGAYSWIRLAVDALPGVKDSYIMVAGSEHELSIPSASQSGLKLNTAFELIANAEFNYTIDFDLRKSVVMAAGDYKLKPTLRLINDAESATITGIVNAALLTDTAGCTDADLSTGNAVYLFENADTVPDDVDNTPAEPFSSALVELNIGTGNYEYTLGFIPEGTYTISFTCQADQDDIEVDNAITFVGTSNVSLTAGQILNLDF